MKEKFVSVNRHKKTLRQIRAINQIVEEYFSQGYVLTVRQVFYQLVARNLKENTLKQYKGLTQHIAYGRLDGIIDWDAIEDRTRQVYLQYHAEDPTDAVNDLLGNYKLDRQKDQPKYIEAWCEKRALANVLKPVTDYYHVKVLIGGGVFSLTSRKEAAERLKKLNKPKLILYLGDHDPAGLVISESIRDALNLFGVNNFEVKVVAITKDQALKYNLPPSPTKKTDTRSQSYIEKYGDNCWELDALEPRLLVDLLKREIKQNLDIPKFEDMLDQENKDKDEISRRFS